MADWNELSAYIRANYRIDTEETGYFKLLFNINEQRSQWVFVHRVPSSSGVEWIHIESPIADIRSANLTALFNTVENMVCGALSKIGNLVTLRHAVLLEDMSVKEFEIPLHAVCTAADDLEGSVSFQDQY